MPEVRVGEEGVIGSNTKECLGADGRVVYPNCNRDCVKMVKQIYPVIRFQRTIHRKQKKERKRVHLTAVEIYIKSEREVRVVTNVGFSVLTRYYVYIKYDHWVKLS